MMPEEEENKNLDQKGMQQETQSRSMDTQTMANFIDLACTDRQVE